MTLCQIDFVAIATALVERGFRVTSVHPETKMGVMKNWQNWQITTPAEVLKYSKGKYANHNVGVVGKRGVGRHCFLDVDAPAVVERIESETKHEMPKGYRVKSSPTSKPYKTHFYFTQTPYSFEKFGGWEAVNSNVKDMTTIDDGKHPTLYDLKGVGGGSLVVGAGSVKQTGEVYTCVDDGPVPEIPDWLVDWLVNDVDKYWDAVDAEKAEKLALKEAEQKRYTPNERVQMRRKNLPEGFDIFFEDRYEYLYKRSCTLSSMGLRARSLEVALTDLLENDVVGGKEYAQTDKGRSMLHKLANNPSLKPGNGSWFYKTKEKRPKRRTPTVSTLSHRRPIILQGRPQTCIEAMVKIIEYAQGSGFRGDPEGYQHPSASRPLNRNARLSSRQPCSSWRFASHRIVSIQTGHGIRCITARDLMHPVTGYGAQVTVAFHTTNARR